VVLPAKRPGEPDCTFADIGKITKSLGWRPEVPFEQGVQHMIQADRSLEGRAIVGSGFDRAGDEDLVRISRRQIGKGAG